MAPVLVKKLTCDGNTHKCTANLVSGLLVLDGWFLRLLLTLFCRAGIWWWALGSTVGRQSLPPLERRLSQVEISQERERSTRAGDVRRIRNMPNVQYTVLFWECDSWFSITFFVDHLKLALIYIQLGDVWLLYHILFPRTSKLGFCRFLRVT